MEDDDRQQMFYEEEEQYISEKMKGLSMAELLYLSDIEREIKCESTPIDFILNSIDYNQMLKLEQNGVCDGLTDEDMKRL